MIYTFNVNISCTQKHITQINSSFIHTWRNRSRRQKLRWKITCVSGGVESHRIIHTTMAPHAVAPIISKLRRPRLFERWALYSIHSIVHTYIKAKSWSGWLNSATGALDSRTKRIGESTAETHSIWCNYIAFRFRASQRRVFVVHAALLP